MFGFRPDGKKIKDIDPIMRMIPFIMTKRYDSMVEFLLEERCEVMDKFIEENYSKGIKISYMHIIIASIVRMYKEKPILNRFVMNGRIYQRKGIFISFAVKRALTEDGEETTVKLEFTGNEDIYEIKEKVDNAVRSNKGTGKENETDKVAKILTKVPTFSLKIAVGFLKFLDKHGLLPKKIIEASPFHTSCFLTNMKSISTDYVYHHLYDFGTTGIFVGLGKEHKQPVVNEFNDEIEIGKVIKIGAVIDERICDGFYYAKSIKVIRKYMRNPYLLTTKVTDSSNEDVTVDETEIVEQQKVED